VSTPALFLDTAFVRDAGGRIVSTREPQPSPGPRFTLVRGAEHCVWAARVDVAATVADEIDRLARTEPVTSDLRAPPRHADRYVALVGGQVRSGPAFDFPATIAPVAGVVVVEDEAVLGRHFRGWVAGEIAAGRAPVMAIVEDGAPVSVCFSARLADVAAHAGVETAAAFRRRGLAVRVTAAWALAMRASGRTPLYNTDWSNEGSRSVAKKLGLRPYAAHWSLGD
jgi:hypothetical protein